VVWSTRNSRVTTLAPYSQASLSTEIKEFRADREQRLVYKLFNEGRTRQWLSRRPRFSFDWPTFDWASVNETGAISH